MNLTKKNKEDRFLSLPIGMKLFVSKAGSSSRSMIQILFRVLLFHQYFVLINGWKCGEVRWGNWNLLVCPKNSLIVFEIRSLFLSFLHVFILGHVYILFAPAKKVFWLRHLVFSCRIIAVKPQRFGGSRPLNCKLTAVRILSCMRI